MICHYAKIYATATLEPVIAKSSLTRNVRESISTNLEEGSGTDDHTDNT
jgi:hypothetical protein